MPAARDDVFTVSGATIVMERFCVSVLLDESFTCAVKPLGPAVVGVPVIAPPVLRCNPAGSAPPETVHVYPPVPPVAESESEYAAPTDPLANCFVVIFSGAITVMVMVGGVGSDCPRLSVTLNVASNEPACVGLPLIEPLLESDRPGGSVPLADHVSGARPPLAARVAVYGFPTVPCGRLFVVAFGAVWAKAAPARSAAAANFSCVANVMSGSGDL